MGTRSSKPGKGDALIVVDLQNDFLPGGALGVRGGDEVIQPVNRCIEQFKLGDLPVFATRDWHPTDHCSFREEGGPWPRHCVADTHGAQFPAGLALPGGAEIISKAIRPEADAYSGFQNTELAQRLRAAGCGRVFITGLATDYCVCATVLDARSAGFDVVVLEDAIRAVDVHPGDGARALTEMRAHGAQVVTSTQVLE